MRVIVCGSRSWTDPWQIRDRLAQLPEGTVVVDRGSAGAERIAANLTWQLKLEHELRRPDWDAGGDGRGADLCLAFWDGTSEDAVADALAEATRAGIPTEVVTRPDVDDVVVAGDLAALIAKGFRLHE
jgi:hypothetical protein